MQEELQELGVFYCSICLKDLDTWTDDMLLLERDGRVIAAFPVHVECDPHLEGLRAVEFCEVMANLKKWEEMYEKIIDMRSVQKFFDQTIDNFSILSCIIQFRDLQVAGLSRIVENLGKNENI